MIITQIVTIDNQQYLYTHSDDGMIIIRDGVEYEEAYDPINSNRTYTQTSHKIIQDTVQTIQQKYQEAQAKVDKFFRIRSRIETLRDEALLSTTKAIYQAILDLFDQD